MVPAIWGRRLFVGIGEWGVLGSVLGRFQSIVLFHLNSISSPTCRQVTLVSHNLHRKDALEREYSLHVGGPMPCESVGPKRQTREGHVWSVQTANRRPPTREPNAYD